MSGLAVIRRAYDVYEEAASLLRLLAAVEAAHLLGEEEKLDVLLSQITALDCAKVADDLEVLAHMDRERQQALRRELTDFSSPSLLTVTEAADLDDGLPSCAEHVASVIPLDPHSRRA